MLVSRWSRYDDILCEITELHVVNNVAWAKEVWFFRCIQMRFIKKKFVLQISLNYDPDCPTNNNSALVQVMACR